MATSDTYVRARIDTATKERALEAMGLSISDAIMLRIADERRLPFEVRASNTIIRKATARLETHKGKRLGSASKLTADLHAKE